MRLLDANSFDLVKTDELKAKGKLRNGGQYAIVSHRWADNYSEITFQQFEKLGKETGDIEEPRKGSQDWEKWHKKVLERRKRILEHPENIDHKTETGLAKIARACCLARQDDIPYVWIDTCCINKGLGSDSSDISRDINSMFRYYKEARVCYTFLLDVSDIKAECNDGIVSFKDSKWFTRGWTLQELLAPSDLRFYDHLWRPIKTKKDRSAEIHTASRIDSKYIENGDFSTACIAVKMSWASRRTTTIRDDMAYCLLGIFGIRMSVMYGEEEDAFLRLQEQLVDKIPDESIFAWTIEKPILSLGDSKRPQSHGLLAPWPSCFRESGACTIDSRWRYKKRRGVGYEVKRQGIQFEIPNKLPDHGNSAEWNNIIARTRRSYNLGLNCWIVGRENKGSVTIRLRKDGGQWRRCNAEKLEVGYNLRYSSMLLLSKTRPCFIPHKVPGDDDWGKRLADEVDGEIENAGRGAEEDV